MTDFPNDGYVRVSQIVNNGGKVGFVPVCHSTWWSWVAEGKAPKPIRLGRRMTVWRAQDVRAFMDQMVRESKY